MIITRSESGKYGMVDGPQQRKDRLANKDEMIITARFSILSGTIYTRILARIHRAGSIAKKRPVYITVSSFSTNLFARMGSMTSQLNVMRAAAAPANAILAFPISLQ